MKTILILVSILFLASCENRTEEEIAEAKASCNKEYRVPIIVDNGCQVNRVYHDNWVDTENECDAVDETKIKTDPKDKYLNAWTSYLETICPKK